MEVTVNGVRLHCREAGRGTPVVFIHAFPLHGGMWEPQLEALPDRWRWLAPDLRGFGRSTDEGDGPYGMDLFADDLAGMLDALDIERAVFCGLSMGGYVALALWHWHPGRVAGLVLCDTHAGADTAERREARRRMARAVEERGAEAAARAMLPDLVAEETRRKRPEVVERVRAMIESAPPPSIVRALEGMAARPDSTELLPTIDVPTLVVVGSDDAITGRDQARFLAGEIPEARLHVVAGAGHLPNLEQPAEFNRGLVHFLEAAVPGRAAPPRS